MKVDKSAVWVFDLDDTLYPEREYQVSGYRHIAERLKTLFKVDISQIIETADEQGKDVLDAICHTLSMSESAKESLLWMYRLHVPNIQLRPKIKEVLDIIQSNYSIAIITDGRSISQRNKLLALGLENIETFVSEEWNEVKPGKLRFQEVEKRYSDAKQFIYVGDNVKKDFVTPNRMGWITIGIKDAGYNIHSQNLRTVESSYLPKIWIDSVSNIQDFLC
ncbi:HAD-IA family hydrolase [Vibrio cholerae]|uniref:HAD family hydrolase n=1 Tax=Vibrio cholerae TaxID=666 RepID=UPI0011D92706|nr:HAD-IA family hydrolase [Vibrio cholerae]EGR0364508.1 2-haloalkanoic acid dehalogenase [Vibrio cholerae]EGR0937118.1 2-haloalkanoic acid dehalogenase [Vibrio cholerae]EIA0768038.1 HAD-IA family hydrolase [Vibrio cholerae]EID0158127.1 HAD-IA family hydrolase [Vibrio cholerae]EII5634400.1 HAD-IA family hydrolase [Vibrio cholerae]